MHRDGVIRKESGGQPIFEIGNLPSSDEANGSHVENQAVGSKPPVLPTIQARTCSEMVYDYLKDCADSGT